MTNEKEQIIIKNVIAGDAKAFAMLVDTYKDMAVILAFNILLNQEDAEEAAQDAFVKAYSSLYTFKADARFKTWLYRIVVNTALNKKKLKKHYSVEISQSLADQLPSDTYDVFAAGVNREHRKHIQAALGTISDNERLCITLYYLSELSIEEIHSLTCISTSNIKVLLYRGRKNLYSVLQKHLKNELNPLIQK